MNSRNRYATLLKLSTELLNAATDKCGNTSRLTQEFILHSCSQVQVGRGSHPSSNLGFRHLPYLNLVNSTHSLQGCYSRGREETD